MENTKDKQVSSHTPDNDYSNFPEWNRDKYSSYSYWAKVCFMAGRNELKAENEKLKADKAVLLTALQLAKKIIDENIEAIIYNHK